MEYNMIHPEEDMDGTPKEQIFLIFDEGWNYVTHGFIHAYENIHTCACKPRNIFLYIPDTEPVIMDMLYGAMIKQAQLIGASRWKGQSVRIYGGSRSEERKLIDFWVEKGFVNDDSVLYMKGPVATLPVEGLYTYKETSVMTQEDRTLFLERHNTIFPSPLDEGGMLDLLGKEAVRLCAIFSDNTLAGESLVFVQDGKGYVECIYVYPEYRHSGAATALMNRTMEYFRNLGLKEVALEVWERNHAAIYFYSKYGILPTGIVHEEYPGIDREF